jgi:hypothetical protein
MAYAHHYYQTTKGLVRVNVGSGAAQTGNDVYTTVLLHMDGADASTDFTDSNAGGSAHTFTANGNAQIKTDSSKFGGASGFFDGTGDYLEAPDHADWNFGSGDWTVDLWFSRTGGSGADRAIVGNYNSAGASVGFMLGLNVGHNLFGRTIIGGVTHTIAGATNITTAGWHHGALVRNGANLHLFLDGVADAAAITTLSGAIATPVSTLGVGRPGSGNFWLYTGYVDELRLSKGSARWIDTFTPPTGAYGP